MKEIDDANATKIASNKKKILVTPKECKASLDYISCFCKLDKTLPIFLPASKTAKTCFIPISQENPDRKEYTNGDVLDHEYEGFKFKLVISDSNIAFENILSYNKHT